MAVSLSSSNLLLLLVSSLDWLSSPGSASLAYSDHASPSAPLEPHLTDCMSSNQETFRCWWSPGSFHNLSAPGALRVFYMKKEHPLISPTSEWKECPEYIYENKECFFDTNHTASWVPYCVQLRSQNNVTYYDENCFTVESIVRPDPPVSLNWTLLKLSPSGLSYDVKVNWEHPPSADVRVGWMRLEYELQYRERNATSWEALEIRPETQQTIYGLQVGTEYEVHIRCRMLAFTKFGEFSDSIFIQMPGGAAFPITLVVVFGIVGILILILLIVVSQQHRVMMILLPPIPAPKIKGIDSELLKKGKLDELNFIMTGEGMGGLPTYAPDFYRDEPWVEFIEVEGDYPDAGEKEDNQSSDTQRLLGLPQPSIHSMNRSCSTAVSFPDGDSGQASCYDPDVPDQDTLMLMATLLPGQPEDGEASLDAAERSPTQERGETPAIQIQTTGPQTWVNTDFYAQVSNVMPSGGVVLSPGQQLRIQEAFSATEKDAQKKGEEREDTKEADGKKHKELQFQLLVVDPEGSGYTSGSNAWQISTPPGAHAPGEGHRAVHPHPHARPAAPAENQPSPYILPDSPPPQFFAPVADYTVIQEVDKKHSLLVDPPPQQSPPSLPQHPAKALPALPVGYVTPDLLGNLAP